MSVRKRTPTTAKGGDWRGRNAPVATGPCRRVRVDESVKLRKPALEHVPKKLTGFFDGNMLQLFESRRFPIDPMSPSDWETL